MYAGWCDCPREGEHTSGEKRRDAYHGDECVFVVVFVQVESSQAVKTR